jgi:Ca2+-binding EF-hand superfamily protein
LHPPFRQQRPLPANALFAVGKAELEQLFSDWAKTGSEDGQVNRTQFESGMNALGITDPLIIEQNFSAFDQNKDGLIDFREFVCGLSTVLRGDMEERLRCAY